jgi:hypothetical protein
VSLHLWAAETEDPLPDFLDQLDPVDKVESTEPSSTDVQLSSKLDESSSVKASTMENSSTDSAQVPAPNNVESTEHGTFDCLLFSCCIVALLLSSLRLI